MSAAETAAREIVVKPTNWCCMGPWPQADCDHVLSHFHADCLLCRKSKSCAHCQERQAACGRVHSCTRVWGADPQQVIERMRAHLQEQHTESPEDEGRLF